jgi:hypothetical protein
MFLAACRRFGPRSILAHSRISSGAYVRNPQTRSKSFAELLSHAAIPGETKMLFLIPDGLAEEIIKQADRHHARP